MGNDPQRPVGGPEEVAARAVARLRSVAEAGHCLVGDSERAHDEALEAACRHLGVPVGLLLVVDDDGRKLRVAAARGLDGGGGAGRGEVVLGEGLSGYVAALGRPVLVHDITADRRFTPVSALGYERLSAVSVPIEYQGQLLGVLTLASPEPRALGEDDLLAAEALAASLALGLRCRRYREAEARNLLGIIRGLATALEAKDAVTRGHSARVAHLSAHLGEELGLGWASLRRLEVAASLHDIGKIGVPERVLNKAGSLSSAEWLLVRRHPVLGAEMVGEIPLLSDLAPLIRGHHERLDGSGYPDGLRGNEIPLESRVIGVCDAFDAMVMPRPYRRRRTPEAALEEIERCAGSQFDPEVVGALRRCLERRGTAHFVSSRVPVRAAASRGAGAEPPAVT